MYANTHVPVCTLIRLYRKRDLSSSSKYEYEYAGSTRGCGSVRESLHGNQSFNLDVRECLSALYIFPTVNRERVSAIEKY